MGNQLERVAPSGEIILDAAHDERSAMVAAAGADFLGREPECPDNPGIERPLAVVSGDLASEREPHIGDIARLVTIMVHAHQCTWRKMISAFLQSLSDGPCGQRLIGLEVAGGLVVEGAAL